MNQKQINPNDRIADAESGSARAIKPPGYNLLYAVVVTLCITGISWLFRSGALQIWDKHPQPGETYQYGWLISLLVAIPVGFFIGSWMMFKLLIWYQDRRDKSQQNPQD